MTAGLTTISARIERIVKPQADRDFLYDLDPHSQEVITACLEPSLRDARPDRFQFERHGYFVADHRDSQPGNPVFNRAVTLRDSWTKGS